jgi:hypothetical protein
MSASQAIGISLMTNALGQPEFPSMNAQGGSLIGLPVIVSEGVGARIVMLNARNILLAEEGLMIDASEQASVEMNTLPTETSSPTEQVELVSFWQRNLVGLRVDRFVTWLRARDSSVEFINAANYGGATSP